MRLYSLALLAGLLPLLVIHICYFWAASSAHVPWCIPYIDSCTSISATGRQVPEYYLFKALMIPAAIFIALYWGCCYQWLMELKCYHIKVSRLILILGIIASLGLILYTVVLGSIGEAYHLQRRIGVTIFFGFTYLAQLLMTYLIGHIKSIKEQYLGNLRSLEWLTFVTLVIGISSVCISFLDRQLYKNTDDAFEWILTALLCLYPMGMAVLWRKNGFRVTFHIDSGGSIKYSQKPGKVKI